METDRRFAALSVERREELRPTELAAWLSETADGQEGERVTVHETDDTTVVRHRRGPIDDPVDTFYAPNDEGTIQIAGKVDAREARLYHRPTAALRLIDDRRNDVGDQFDGGLGPLHDLGDALDHPDVAEATARADDDRPFRVVTHRDEATIQPVGVELPLDATGRVTVDRAVVYGRGRSPTRATTDDGETERGEPDAERREQVSESLVEWVARPFGDRVSDDIGIEWEVDRACKRQFVRTARDERRDGKERGERESEGAGTGRNRDPTR